MKQLYNEDIKEEFLNQFPEGTATQYRYGLYRAYETEDMLGRDLFTFSTDEIKKALIDANHSTMNSLYLTFSAFKYYFRWAVGKGYTNSNINPIDSISEKELNTFIDKNKKLYITIDELKEMEAKLDNAQDAICVRLPFEGVSGYKASEISNLHYYDVDWNNNMLKLKDDKYGKRELKVSDECIRLMMSAYTEEEYTQVRQDIEIPFKKILLQRTDYIVKNSQTKRTKNVHGVDSHTVYRRLSKIKTLFDLPFLNIKNIEKSGMIYMATKLYERDGELGKTQVTEIAEHFGVSNVVINGIETYNYSILNRTINRENILNLYGLDINE